MIFAGKEGSNIFVMREIVNFDLSPENEKRNENENIVMSPLSLTMPKQIQHFCIRKPIKLLYNLFKSLYFRKCNNISEM